MDRFAASHSALRELPINAACDEKEKKLINVLYNRARVTDKTLLTAGHCARRRRTGMSHWQIPTCPRGSSRALEGNHTIRHSPPPAIAASPPRRVSLLSRTKVCHLRKLGAASEQKLARPVAYPCDERERVPITDSRVTGALPFRIQLRVARGGRNGGGSGVPRQ